MRKEKINKFNSFLTESKFNRMKRNDDGFIEDFLFIYLSEYFNISVNDDINYDITNYSVRKTKEDADFEYHAVYWLEIMTFEIKIDLNQGTLELGEIKHRGHLMDLIGKNWDLISLHQKEKMKVSM